MPAGRDFGTTAGMDATTALPALPDRYAYALRMRDEGLDDAAIARILVLDPVSIRPFLAIAEAKVAELAGCHSGVSGRNRGPDRSEWPAEQAT